jgi:adenylate cyclase
MGADEEGTRARLRLLHAEVIEPKISADGGRIVKTTGDGMLVAARLLMTRSRLDGR